MLVFGVDLKFYLQMFKDRFGGNVEFAGEVYDMEDEIYEEESITAKYNKLVVVDGVIRLTNTGSLDVVYDILFFNMFSISI